MTGGVRSLRSMAPEDQTLIEHLVERTPGVVGGSARIVRTRIPVWTLECYRRQGASDAEIIEDFPVLRPVDLRAAWAYVKENRSEIERDIAENEAA